MYKLVIIDLDGTLVDSKKDITSTLNRSFEYFGLPPLSEELVASHVGTGIKPLIDMNVPTQSLKEFQSFFDKTYIENIAANTQLYEGWLDFFNSTLAIEKVILSNKLQKFCDPLVSALGLRKYLSNVYGRDAFRKCKPSGFPIIEILKLLGYQKNESLMVGDTVTDILSAKDAGIASCAVNFGYGDIADLIKLAPEVTIENPRDLLTYFKTKQE